jgi:hypothetical protein
MQQGKFGNEVRKSMMVDGAKLDVVARQIDDGEWELFVENIYKIRSVWIETFNTAQSALANGVKAIESEGIEPFMDTEGFEYLFKEGDI